MDIARAIKELEKEKKRLDEAIKSLEGLLAAEKMGEVAPDVKPARQRGRKIMTPEERLAVSDRMRRYWEARRAKPDA